jgi:hypothetical protein
VTTILGVLNKPALVKWANNLGLQGIDSSKYTDKLASIGPLAHSMVECEWTGEVFDSGAYSPEQISLAENALLSFFAWQEEHNVKPLLVEVQLVSGLGFGGTIDCYAVVDGVMTLIDLKTGKGIYPEHFHQLAAYSQLLAENDYAVENVRILRIGRTEDEGFEERVVTREQLKPHWEIFEACLKIYGLQKKTRGG